MIGFLSLKALPGRIAGFCCMAGEEKRDGRYLVAPGISQRELSKIVGATPGAVSRGLGCLSRQGMVRSTSRESEILDRAGLAAVAGGDGDTAGGGCGVGRRNGEGFSGKP